MYALVCYWLLAGIAACTAPDPEMSLADAARSFESGDYRTARIHAQNVLQQDPRNWAARMLAGRISLLAGDSNDAKTHLELARDAGASLAQYALPLAEALAATNDPEEALALLMALETENHSADYWLLQAEVLSQIGRLDEADSALTEAGREDGQSARVFLGRAKVAAARGNVALALDLANSAVTLEPDNSDALAFRGSMITDESRLAEAEVDLMRAAALYENSFRSAFAAPLLLSAMQIQLAQNRVDEASTTANRLSGLMPNAAFSSYAQGLVAYERGDFEETVQLLRQAINQAPNQPEFLTLLGAAHLAIGNFGQAEQQFLAVLSQNQSDPAAIRLLAETRIRQQRPQAALDALRLFNTDVDAEDFRLLTLQGAAHLQSGEAELAIPYLEQARDLDPANQALLLQLVQAYSMSGRSEEAAAILQSAPDLSAGFDYSANVAVLFSRLQNGDIESARAYVEELLANGDSDAGSHMVAAIFNELTNDYDAAKLEIERALQIDDTLVPAHLILAGALAREDRPVEAEHSLLTALELEPDNLAAMLSLAQLATERRDFEAARTHLIAAAAASDSSAPRIALARVYIAQGELDLASAEIDRVADADPSEPQIPLVRGIVALASGSNDEAVVLLRDAEQNLSDRPNVALLLARAHLLSGDDLGALAVLETAIDRMPGVVNLRSAFGEIALRTGDAAEALRVAQQLQTEFGQQAMGYALEGQVRFTQRLYDDAARMYELAYQRDANWNLLVNLIAARRLSTDAGGEQSLVNEWLNRAPGDIAARLFLGELLLSANRLEEALTENQRVLEIDPNNIVGLNNGAWVAHLLSRPEALGYAQKAVGLAPDSPAVLDTLGWILTEQNRPEEALPHLDKAAQLSPQALEIRYHLGFAQAQLGQTQAARATLEALLGEARQFETRDAAIELLNSL